MPPPQITNEEIRAMFTKTEAELLENGTPLHFAKRQARQSVVNNVADLGFGRCDAVYMVYKAMRG